MPEYSTVHVGIVTYNSLTDLPHCFTSLEAQDYPNFDVTVFDNASEDASVTWIEEHMPQVNLIENSTNIGFGPAHNRIVQYINLQSGDYYMPLNPDIVLTSGYISSLVAGIEKVGSGWITGKLLMLSSEGQLTDLIYSVGHALRRDGYVFNIGYGQPDNGQFNAQKEIFGACAAAPIFTQALIAAVAPDGELLDSDMFMYFEDTDLDWRARRLGWRCWYTPDAVAYHRGGTLRGSRQVDALANRYLSVIKNAFIIDLIFYNLPILFVHWIARLILSPSLGLQMVTILLQKAPRMWRKRQRPLVSRQNMLAWFQWATDQPTNQQRSVSERLQKFRHQHRTIS